MIAEIADPRQGRRPDRNLAQRPPECRHQCPLYAVIGLLLSSLEDFDACMTHQSTGLILRFAQADRVRLRDDLDPAASDDLADDRPADVTLAQLGQELIGALGWQADEEATGGLGVGQDQASGLVDPI
jgi:hypothetical protein